MSLLISPHRLISANTMELTRLADPAFRTSVWIAHLGSTMVCCHTMLYFVLVAFPLGSLRSHCAIRCWCRCTRTCWKVASKPQVILPSTLAGYWQLCLSLSHAFISYLIVVLCLTHRWVILIHFDPPRLRDAHQSFPSMISLSYPYRETIACFRVVLLSCVTATLSYIGSILVVGYSSVFESQVISSPLFDQC